MRGIRRLTTGTNALRVVDFVLFALFAWQILLFLGLGFEDADICNRCARYFVRGAGLVYTPGEWVESVSNLSWTLLLAGMYRLGFELHWADRLLVIVSSLLFWGVFREVSLSLFGRERWRSRLPLLGIACATYLSASFGNLLEGSGVALMVAVLIWGMSKRNWGLMAVAGIALMTLRPEGPIFAAAAGAWLLVEAMRRRTAWASVWKYMAFTECTLILLLLFRFWYYGDLVPNTVRSKGPGVGEGAFPLNGDGITYITGYLRYAGPGLLLLPLPALLNRTYRPIVVGCLALALLNMGVTGARGDWMQKYRLLTPYLPLLLLSAVAGIASLERFPRIVWAGVVVLGISFAGMCTPSEILNAREGFNRELLRPAFVLDSQRYVARNVIGPSLTNLDLAWPDDLFVINWGGGNGWLLDGVPSIEISGLTDRSMNSTWLGLQEHCVWGVHNWRAALDKNPTGFVYMGNTNWCLMEMLRHPATADLICHHVVFRGVAIPISEMSLREDREVATLCMRSFGDFCPVSDYRVEMESTAPCPFDNLSPWQHTPWTYKGVSVSNAWLPWGLFARASATFAVDAGNTTIRRPLRDATPIVLALGLGKHEPLTAQLRVYAESADGRKLLKTLYVSGNDTENFITCACGIEGAELEGASTLALEVDANVPGTLLLGAYRWAATKLPVLPSEYVRACWQQAVQFSVKTGNPPDQAIAEAGLAAFEASDAATIDERLARKRETFLGALVLRDIVRKDPGNVAACNKLDAYYLSTNDNEARCAEWSAMTQRYPSVPEVWLRLAQARLAGGDRAAGLQAVGRVSALTLPSHPVSQRIGQLIPAPPESTPGR